jgi:hypothetical protein
MFCGGGEGIPFGAGGYDTSAAVVLDAYDAMKRGSAAARILFG